MGVVRHQCPRIDNGLSLRGNLSQARDKIVPIYAIINPALRGTFFYPSDNNPAERGTRSQVHQASLALACRLLSITYLPPLYLTYST